MEILEMNKKLMKKGKICDKVEKYEIMNTKRKRCIKE